MKLAGRVEGLEKNIPIALNELHKTLSKSFGMQRKALMRLVALEKKVDSIPRGVTTIKGQKGDTGKAGKSGSGGRRKRRWGGPKVTTGSGVDGTSGSDGIDGTSGTDGFGGTSGTDGSSGAGGSDGLGGASGADGIDGIDKALDGIDGASGSDGLGGSDGSSGAGGSDGIGGASGASGASGADGSDGEKKIHKSISKLAGHTRSVLKRVVTLRRTARGNAKKITLLKNIIKSQQSDLGEKLKSLDPVGSPLETSIQTIVDSLTSIQQTLIDQQDLDKGKEDDADIDAEQDKRDAKEGAREGGGIGEGLKKTGEKMLAPVKKSFGSIMDWIKKFFMAKAVMMFMNWFSDPANAKKVSSLFRFIKDWWPAILTGLLLFAGSMLGPTGIIIGIGALVVGFIPKIVNSIKQLFGFTKDTNKEAAKGEKEAAKAEALADKQDKKDESGDLKPEDDVGDAPEPGTTPLEPPAQEFNKGGQVTGTGDKDTVPAMLTPGEFVMSKGAVEQYGVNTLEGMNAAAGGTNKPEGVPLKANSGGLVIPQTPLVNGYKGGGVVKPQGKNEREDLKILANMQQTQMKQFFGITNTKAGLIGDFESGFREQTQEELNAENNAKLPLGLKMTRDGQNIDLGKFAGDKARMIGEMASDPKFAKALKEKGKEFGFSDMTGAQFKEMANKQGDELQREINQYTAGTDAYEMAEISESINFSTQKFKPTGGPLIPGAPTPPTTTVAYQQAQSTAQNSGGGTAASAGTQIPSFSASVKLSPHKVKVLGISR
jgi:hypothetical protein